MAKPYGRLVFTRRNGMDFPDWEMFRDLCAEVVAILAGEEIAPNDDKARKLMRERAGVMAPRKPAMGYVIGRAITHVRAELRKRNLLIDEKKKGVDSGLKIYRIFKREEVVGDIEHSPDQLLVFDKKHESINGESSLDDDVESLLNDAISHVTTFTMWRDVREMAERALGATGAVKTDLGYIVLPVIYEKVDMIGDMFEMMGLSFEHFKIAPEDQNKTDALLKDSLVEEIESILNEVDQAVATLEKKKCIRDRLTVLERVQGRVALYSTVLEDVQEELLSRVERAQNAVNEKLGDI